MTEDVLGTPAQRVPIARPIEVIIVVVGLFLLIGQFTNFQQNQESNERLASGEQRTYQTRAVICNLQKGQGLPESPGCADDRVTPHRNNTITSGSATAAIESVRARELLCVVVLQQNMHLEPDMRLIIPPSLCPSG